MARDIFRLLEYLNYGAIIGYAIIYLVAVMLLIMK